MKQNAIVVMYSGGLDSTLQAYRLAKKYQHVYLLTFDLSLTIGVNNSTKNIENIRRACPSAHIEHHIINIDKTRNLFWKSFADDYFDYCDGTSPAILCLSCKMAMLTETVRFCLRNGIDKISNGLTGSQSDHPEHLPEIINRFTKVMEQYGINFVNDIYHIETREQEIKELQAANIETGIMIGASNVSHQPRCFVGVYSTLWKAYKTYDRDHICRYFDDKKELIIKSLERETRISNKLQGNSVWLEEGVARSYTHEFGKNADKILGTGLYPIWFLSRQIFKFFKKKK